MIIPGGQPYLLPGGPFGCLLIHSLAFSPQEVRWLGNQLNQDGFSVLAVRLFGHATKSEDLARARYTDWIASMENGLSLLKKRCDKLIVVGSSLGSALALIAGAKHPVDAVVAISPYFDLSSYATSLQLDNPNPLQNFLRVGKQKVQGVSSLPGFLADEESIQTFYRSIPTRTFSELGALLTEMRRVLPNVDVPTLLIQTQCQIGDQDPGATQILEHLTTKRVELIKIEMDRSEETLHLKRERVTGAITRFVTQLPGFQQ